MTHLPVVALMTTLDTNIGDDFIRDGIIHLLEEVLGRFNVAYINKHDSTSLFSARADETKLYGDKFWDADLVVQCGAPVFWHLGEAATPLTSEWYQWLWRDRILDANEKGERCPKFINLGAGSCSYWGQGAQPFLSSADCADFARSAVGRAALTVVRDPVAAEILQSLRLKHEILPCPAFLAALRHARKPKAEPEWPLIGLNLMELGGHFATDPSFEKDAWQRFCQQLIELLQSKGDVVLLAHDEVERKYLSSLDSQLRIVLPSSYHEYHGVLRQLSLWIGNRVHGAVCAAGYGVPALILGNDTRARIGEYIGLKVLRSSDRDFEAVSSWVDAFHSANSRELEAVRLRDLQQETRSRYIELLTEAVRPK
jgi:hypothetical protein